MAQQSVCVSVCIFPVPDWCGEQSGQAVRLVVVSLKAHGAHICFSLRLFQGFLSASSKADLVKGVVNGQSLVWHF